MIKNTHERRRVCVATFHRSANYGAVLQTYALQQALNSLGYDARVLDYIPSVQGSQRESLCRRFLKKTKNCLNIRFLYKALRLRLYSALRRKRADSLSLQCGKFLERRIQLDDSLRFLEGRWEINQDVYAVITGSDQVWHIGGSEYDPVYFLDFETYNARRIAYAPSLGGRAFPLTLQERLGEVLNSYKSISIREKSSQEGVESYIQRSVTVVPDPVFLIDLPFFEDHVLEESLPEHYILVYRLSQSYQQTKEFNQIIKMAEHLFRLPVVSISPNNVHRGYGKSYDLPSPEGFVAMINQASLVITNSFHGLALSLIHNTNVYACSRDEYGGSQDARLHDLLDEFGLRHRFIRSSDSLVESYNSNDAINWSNVDERKVVLRKKGIDFLKRALD